MHVAVEASLRPRRKRKCSVRSSVTGEKYCSCIVCHYFHVSERARAPARSRSRPFIPLDNKHRHPPATRDPFPNPLRIRCYCEGWSRAGGRVNLTEFVVGRQLVLRTRIMFESIPPIPRIPETHRPNPLIFRLILYKIFLFNNIFIFIGRHLPSFLIFSNEIVLASIFIFSMGDVCSRR